jgi:hypothetical protein
MRAWRKPKREDAGVRIAERWHRSAPVFVVCVGAAADTRDLSAVASQIRTTVAHNDALVQDRSVFG